MGVRGAQGRWPGFLSGSGISPSSVLALFAGLCHPTTHTASPDGAPASSARLPSVSAAPARGSFTWKAPTQRAQAVPQEPAPGPHSRLRPLLSPTDEAPSAVGAPGLQLPSQAMFPPAPKGPGFPGGSAGKESTCNAGDPGSIPGLGRSPGEGTVFWPGEFHGLYSPWGRKELDRTERFHSTSEGTQDSSPCTTIPRLTFLTSGAAALRGPSQRPSYGLGLYPRPMPCSGPMPWQRPSASGAPQGHVWTHPSLAPWPPPSEILPEGPPFCPHVEGSQDLQVESKLHLPPCAPTAPRQHSTGALPGQGTPPFPRFLSSSS